MTTAATTAEAPAVCAVGESFDRMAAVFAEAPPELQDESAVRDVQALRDKHNAQCTKGCAS